MNHKDLFKVLKRRRAKRITFEDQGRKEFNKNPNPIITFQKTKAEHAGQS